jgi:hypothetical protein
MCVALRDDDLLKNEVEVQAIERDHMRAPWLKVWIENRLN